MQVANGDDATSAGHGAHADDDHSQLSVDQSTTIAGVFYSETTDQASHGEHVSTMSHDLAHALMAQATSPDAEMHSLQPEI